nr:VWA-like domain-containing protein [uncultured Dorea sp.]
MCVEIIKVASEVLNFSRQRTLVNMRFLEPAIRMLTESPSKCMRNRSYGMGTDGKNLYYNPEYVLRAYQKEKGFVSRMYLHLVVHGIFRHFFVNPQIEQRKWDLACDMATEYIIESWKLDFADISAGADEKRELDRIRKNVGLMNAEKIYGYLKKTKESEIDRLEKIFRRDDHSFWYPETKNRNDVIQVKSGQVNQNREVMFSNQKLEELWKQAAKKIQVDLETFMRSRSDETGDFLVNLKLANRKKQDYSAFLRKFTRLGERMKINDEEFDYNFYTYGMQLYGNMPLIEPLEYKDVRVVKTFVTVIDTSGSVEEEKLRRFLEKTYQILKSGQKSKDRVNFHLIQCDALVQKDVKITSEKELEQVMEDLTLYGRGGTDFRPAFEYIEELRKNGELTNLNGMLYFTDGMGVYPRKKPEYPVAFIYDSEVLDKIPEVPAWAIRYLMDDI